MSLSPLRLGWGPARPQGWAYLSACLRVHGVLGEGGGYDISSPLDELVAEPGSGCPQHGKGLAEPPVSPALAWNGRSLEGGPICHLAPLLSQEGGPRTHRHLWICNVRGVSGKEEGVVGSQLPAPRCPLGSSRSSCYPQEVLTFYSRAESGPQTHRTRHLMGLPCFPKSVDSDFRS